MATAAPASASAIAVARPMPRLAPVTRATRCSSLGKAELPQALRIAQKKAARLGSHSLKRGSRLEIRRDLARPSALRYKPFDPTRMERGGGRQTQQRLSKPRGVGELGPALLGPTRCVEGLGLVAGDGFGGFRGLGRRSGITLRMAVLVRVPVAVPGGRGDRDGLTGEVRRNGPSDVVERANLHNPRLRLFENQLFVDGANLGLLFEGLLAANAVFFGRGHRDVVLDVADASGIRSVDLQRMLVAAEVDVLALGVDFMFAVGAVPLGDGGVLVHIFEDLAPADTGVVSAEADFTLLRAVRNDAHFGAAEVVVEQILEPHPGDEQEVPRILRAALYGIVEGTAWRGAAVFDGSTLGERPGLIELLEHVKKL